MTRPKATYDDPPRSPRDDHSDGKSSPAETLSPIRLDDIDPHAIEVVETLELAGYEAYLVGGCVRDLLLGLHPKDFDIATNAPPREVQRHFRRARVIGRRFKLTHVVYPYRDRKRPPKIIEVSTFRKSPSEESMDDGLIVRDNEFGTLKEDAMRRDFTVNALFYDIQADEVIDYVGGLGDLKRRLLKTIGDPDKRLREDPVRMLRAVKFAARLDLDIDFDLREAISHNRHDLAMSAPPRILEELIRILSSGSAAKAFELLIDSELIDVVLPEFARHLELSDKEGEEDHVESLLARLDIIDRDLKGVRRYPASHYLGLLYVGPVLQVIRNQRLRGARLRDWVDKCLYPILLQCRIPKRDMSELRDALIAQSHFWGEGKRHKGVTKFRRHPGFRNAFRLFQIVCEAHGEESAMVNWENRVEEIERSHRAQSHSKEHDNHHSNGVRHSPKDEELASTSRPTRQGKRRRSRSNDSRRRTGDDFGPRV